MAAYADYTYYTDDYGGTLIPQGMFNGLSIWQAVYQYVHIWADN